MSRSAFTSAFRVPQAKRPRSSFDRSHSLKTTIWDDVITPVFLDLMYPGDSISIGTNSFVRMNPTLSPIMDNVWMDTHYFFVPLRLLWDNFQKFMGEQTNPGDSTSYVIPQLTTPAITGHTLYSLADYYGLPIENPNIESVSALPHRAYALIYNTWYRDEDIQQSVAFSTGNGPDAVSGAFGALQFSCKRPDYFTSARPWPQKGPEIMIPTSDSVPVLGIGKDNQIFNAGGTLVYESDGTTSTYTNASFIDGTSVNNHSYRIEGTAATGGYPNIRADLTENTDATITALTQAFALQRFGERDQRGGTRYIEKIYSHFGVVSDDARLQNPEYLGGNSVMINMHPLAQTSETGTSPQGNLAGNGSVVNTGLHISKGFSEHGYVIGLVRFRGDVSYSQGIDRQWSYETMYDFFWPDLQNIGDQAILTKEVYADGTADDQLVLGYAPRYSENMFKKNWLSSNMRPGVTDTTDFWNLSQEFASHPTLDTVFISSDTPFDRVLQVPTQPTFLADFYFKYKHARVMATHSIPGKGNYL